MRNSKNHQELPKGWKIARFDEILRKVDRKIMLDDSSQYDCVGVRWYGLGAFVRERLPGMDISRKQQWVIKAGDVVYNKLFAWKGAFAIADGSVDGCIVSDKFPTYEANLSIVDPDYLGYYFRSPKLAQQAQNLSKGAAAISKLTLNPPQFWELTMPLPSLDEQKRIIRRIKELSTSIEKARNLRQQAIEETKVLFGSVSDAIVESLTQSYNSQSLSDLVEPDRGISYGVVLTGTPYEGGIPTLRAGDLQTFHVLLGNVKRIDPHIEAKYKRTRLLGNEILLRIRGGLGEVAVCPPEMIGGNVSREIAVIPLKKDILPKYCMYVLAAPCNQAKMVAQLRGTSYVGINLKDVRQLRIPIPPLSKQRRIVDYLDNLQMKVKDVKKLQADTNDELNAIMPSVLDKAFKGGL